jgi:hypothetical protein
MQVERMLSGYVSLNQSMHDVFKMDSQGLLGQYLC